MKTTGLELGRMIEWGWIQFGERRGTGYLVMVDEEQVIRCLIADANETLPPGTRFDIRKRFPGNYGRTFGVAWFHRPSMANDAAWGTGEFPRSDAEMGVNILKQLVAERP